MTKNGLYFKKYYFKSWNAADSIKLFFAKQSQFNRLIKEVDLKDYKTVSLSFVGDIMWIRNGWSSFLDESVRRYLSESDMVFGNLETPIDTLCIFLKKSEFWQQEQVQLTPQTKGSIC